MARSIKVRVGVAIGAAVLLTPAAAVAIGTGVFHAQTQQTAGEGWCC